MPAVCRRAAGAARCERGAGAGAGHRARVHLARAIGADASRGDGAVPTPEPPVDRKNAAAAHSYGDSQERHGCMRHESSSLQYIKTQRPRLAAHPRPRGGLLGRHPRGLFAEALAPPRRALLARRPLDLDEVCVAKLIVIIPEHARLQPERRAEQGSAERAVRQHERRRARRRISSQRRPISLCARPQIEQRRAPASRKRVLLRRASPERPAVGVVARDVRLQPTFPDV